MGWYLDNLELDTAGSEIPEEVAGPLRNCGKIPEGTYAKLCKVEEEPDVENYRIERRSADSEFEEVAMLDKRCKRKDLSIAE